METLEAHPVHTDHSTAHTIFPLTHSHQPLFLTSHFYQPLFPPFTTYSHYPPAIQPLTTTGDTGATFALHRERVLHLPTHC